VADLELVELFVRYDTARVPLLEPLPGDTVHQDVALDTAVQLTLEVTPTEALPDEDPVDPLLVLKDKFEEPPDVQNDLVSVAPNCPPVISEVEPCLMVYEPLPYAQHMPSPYVSFIVNV